MSNLSTRTLVAKTLIDIQNGQSLNARLDPLLASLPTSDKAFAHALLLTTLRHWYATARLVDKLADKPIDETEIRTIIQMGITQLVYLNVADHASIFETVEAVKQIGLTRAAGLVNALLRKVAKQPNKYHKLANKNHSLPNWLAWQLKQDWGEQYAALTDALRQPAATFLRVNAKFCTVQAYASLLQEAKIKHDMVPIGYQDIDSIRLDDTVNVIELPKFAEGWVSVQDVHAQLAGHLITSMTDHSSSALKVMDACCAPGGKTAHLLELAKAAGYTSTQMFHMKQLIAADNEPKRLKRVWENLERLKLLDKTLEISVQTQDATVYHTKEPFDVILLDAPCTATGVMRRHPDIGLLRTAADVEQTVKLQANMLSNLWDNLAEGGYLLYVTCSILKAENEEQLAQFLRTCTDAGVIEFKLTLANQYKRPIGWQCLPLDEKGGDGFYYAMLQKRRLL